MRIVDLLSFLQSVDTCEKICKSSFRVKISFHEGDFLGNFSTQCIEI